MNNYYDFIGKEFLQKNGYILRIVEVSSVFIFLKKIGKREMI